MDAGPPTLVSPWPIARASERDRPVWLALVVGMALVITTGSRPGGETLVAMLAIGVVLAIAVRWSVAPLAIAVLLVVGIGLRASIVIHTGSDVLDVVATAIRHVELGLNPYGIGYFESRPPGAPYAYGPLPLLWYAPVLNGGWQIELLMASLVLTLLAMRGKLLGLAIYAMAPTLIATSGDGSNDTSAGVLLLAALVVARQRPLIGAVLLAVAMAFKPYIAAWAPAFLLWSGWWGAALFIGASVVLWSPVLFAWGIPSFLASLELADKIHNSTYWSFGELWESVFHHPAPRDQLNAARLVMGALTALLTLRWARSLDGVILAGTLVYLVTLYLGYWSTYAYLAAIGPILCWRVDAWLHLPTRPLVALPGEEPDGTEVEAGAPFELDRNTAAT
jgi:hypothetical protein